MTSNKFTPSRGECLLSAYGDVKTSAAEALKAKNPNSSGVVKSLSGERNQPRIRGEADARRCRSSNCSSGRLFCKRGKRKPLASNFPLGPSCAPSSGFNFQFENKGPLFDCNRFATKILKVQGLDGHSNYEGDFGRGRSRGRRLPEVPLLWDALIFAPG